MNYLHHKFCNLVVLLSISLLIGGCTTTKPEELNNAITKDFGPERVFGFQPVTNMTSGNFSLKNNRNNQPIADYMIHILEPKSGILITSANTNSSGEAKVDGLIEGKEYLIKIAPFAVSLESDSENVGHTYIHQSSANMFPLETYIERKASHIDVPTVLQYPELPNGCEITSLTAVLNYYGIDVSKTIMADDYLPQLPFRYDNDHRTGPNPQKAFAGNPRDLKGGWYVFAEPIVKAAKDVIATYEMDLKVENISGSTREEILSYIDQKIPVIIWVTLDLSPPNKRGGWYIEETNDFHSSFTNLHSVVLQGWENGEVHIMDPLKGHVILSEQLFFESYEALGSQAVIIKE